MQKVFLAFLILLISSFNLSAQEESEGDVKAGDLIFSISAYYAYEKPAGDLESRFGFNHKIGAAFIVKLPSNWVISIDGGYMFGQDLKEEAYSVLDNLKTDKGQITSKYGTPGNILLGERGYSIMLKGGKILPFLQSNENSGPLLMGGIGFLEHKIRIDNDGNDTPQIYEEYKKGYDHLTNGIAFSQFIGYQHYANNKMANFYIGVEMTQAFTKNRRGYNYNTMDYDTDARLDMLYSLKVGLVVPFSRRAPKAFYTY